MSNQAQCSHSRISRHTFDLAGGHTSEFWKCDTCESHFVREDTDQGRVRLRDWLAGMALQGMLCANSQAMPEVSDKNVDAVLAREAYLSADAMLAERVKSK